MFLSIKKIPKLSWTSAKPFNLKPKFSTLFFLCFGLTLFGIGVFLFVLLRYVLLGAPVQGFTFLASTIAIFSGVQLFVFGIFGEYLARMYSRIMDRPTYIIQGKKQSGKTE